MQKFELVLRNEKVKLYDRFAILIFLLNAIAICFFLYYNYQAIKENPLALACGGAALLMLCYFMFIPAVSKSKNVFLLAAAPVALYWVLIGYWWIGFILVFLFAFYLVAKRHLMVNVSNTGILYPSFPQRKFSWQELNNMILKDGLLTIDFKNNRIIQQMTDSMTKTLNEKEFNDFCKAQLKATASEPNDLMTQ